MKNLRNRGLWLAGILALMVACGTDQTPYVAHIGKKKISVAEFEQRAQKLLRTGYRDLDTLDQAAKQKLLDAMLAQELLVLEGLNRGLDRDSVIAGEVQETAMKATLAHLYEKEALKGDYTPTEEELQRFFVEGQYDTEVLSQQILCATEAEAGEALRALQAGEPFPSLVRKYSPESIQRRFGLDGDIGWFKMADMLEPLKEPLRTMPVGQIYPRPVKSELGYHVFKLNGRRAVSFDSVRDLLVKLLQTQKRTRDRERYVGELRQRYALTAHPEGLRHLGALPPDQKEWPGDDELLFTWKGGQLTARNFLAKHRQGKANHPASLDSAGLHKAADNLAGQQIMIAEARRLGYDQDQEIREPVENRRNELMIRELSRLEGEPEAEISEAAVRQYYAANLDRYRTADGKVADFALVRRSIHRFLQQTAHAQAMDRFIDQLREKYRSQIELHPELLEQVTLSRQPVSPTAGS